LAAAVETRYAFIAEFVAVKRVRSLAFWCRDRVVDNVEWDLPGTPCEEAPRVTDGVADGTANTLAIITAAEAVPWTKPADLAYSPDKKLPPLGPGMINDGLLSFATADSSVWVTRNTQDEKLMRALITRSGFEDIDMKNLRK
jgi:hypothetical protein